MARLGRSYIRYPLAPRYSIPLSVIWYALYDTTTGALLSLGTVVPDTLPGGSALVALTSQPDLTVMWDPITCTFIPKPPDTVVDRAYTDLPADATLATMWSQLDATQTDILKARIATLLGPYRFRFVFQDVDLF
jgi:hypothetical protein